MKQTIKTDWNDIKSIKAGERKQARLENQGYNLIATTCGLFICTSHYVKDKNLTRYSGKNSNPQQISKPQ